MTDSADKRSVATDAIATLGMILDGTQKRDAIHLAVEPVVAGEFMGPGEHITIENGVARRVNPGKGLGIVDPFLLVGVEKGQHFWFIMYPRKISSLRHVWAHPSFPDEPEIGAPVDAADIATKIMSATIVQDRKVASEMWLREFCRDNDCPGYDAVMSAILDKSDGSTRYDDEYLHFSGSDAHGDIPDEFWDHVAIVTGRNDLPRAKYFSCSC